MYSVNGVPLENPTLGWSLLKPTKPLAELTWERPSLRGQSMDGVLPGLPASLGAPVVVFVVQTSRTNYGALVALFADGGTITKTGDSTKSIAFEVLGTTYEALSAESDSLIAVTFQARFPSVYWRDSNTVTSTAASLSSSVQVSGLLPGITGIVPDAVIRIKGQASGVQVTDSGGSWFTYSPNFPAGSYLRFECATGRAYVTTSDTWSGGTDVSGVVDFGGPRGVFELTPLLAAGNPASRSARLTVTTATNSGATLQLRGRATYLL